MAPALFVAMAAIPGLAQTKAVAGSIGCLVLVALQSAALPLIRSAGVSRQESLYSSWGGKPTTAMLRHRDERINIDTKKRLHERLRGLGADFSIPTEVEEIEDPNRADGKYASAVDELRKRAKAKAVKAVHRENIGYGAARNLYGLKPFGLFVCATGLMTLGWLVGASPLALPK